MAIRKIVNIDGEKCDGCGLCIPNCAEGALKIIDGKAKLVSDEFCDGLGACLGHCPRDAITITEREAEEFNEKVVKQHIAAEQEKKNLKNVHHETPHACPGSRIITFDDEESSPTLDTTKKLKSELRQWPIQLKLVSPTAPYFQNADLLIAADCVPFSYADFHRDFLRGKTLVMGCPKLDDSQYYTEKLTQIFKLNKINSVTLLNMEVPCCFGMQKIVEGALQKAGKVIPVRQTIITIRGEKQ
ncbi:ATP-binding protein [[Eubacterium] cellulosolvens]